MVLTTSLSKSWRVLFQTDTKEQKLIMYLVIPLNYIRSSTRVNFGPFIFQYLYLWHIFWHNRKWYWGYGNDNKPCQFNLSLDNVIINLLKSTNSLLNWFRGNTVKANTNKCHLLVSSDESCTAKTEDFCIKNSTKEKLFGVKFDSNLSFENHFTSLCKTTNRKLHPLARIAH